MGAGAYGLYTLGTNIIGIFRKSSTLGLEKAALRFIPHYESKNKRSELKGTLLLVIFCSFGVSAIVGLLLFFFSNGISKFVFDKPDFVTPLKGFAIGLPFYTLAMVSMSVVRGFQNMKRYTAIKLTRPIGLLTIIPIFFFAGYKLNGAVTGYVISVLIAAALGSYFVFLHFSGLVSEVKVEFKKIFRFSIPLYFSNFTRLMMSRVDILMLGYFAASEDVGLYRAAFLLSSLAVFALTAMNVAFTPMISELYTRERIDELDELYKISTRWIFTLSFLSVLVLAYYPDQILGLWGAEFTAGSVALMAMIWFQLVAASVGSVGYLLQMSENQDLVLYINMTSGILNILLNLWLIPNFGILGAALATGSSLAFNNFVGLYFVWRKLGLQPWTRKYWKPIAAGLVTYGVFLGLNYVSLLWLVKILLIALSFSLGLIIFGLPREDRVILKAIVSKFGLL